MFVKLLETLKYFLCTTVGDTYLIQKEESSSQLYPSTQQQLPLRTDVPSQPELHRTLVSAKAKAVGDGRMRERGVPTCVALTLADDFVQAILF